MRTSRMLLTLLVGMLCLATAPARARETPRGADPNGEVKAQKAEGGLRYSIQVRKFANEAEWPSGYKNPYYGSNGLGDDYTTVLTNALHGSEHFIVVADKEMTREAQDEQTFESDAGTVKQGKKTAVRGQMTPAQLLVKGSITRIAPDKGFLNIGEGKSYTDWNKWIPKIGKSSTEIDVTVQVVDASTREVLASKTVTGKTSSAHVEFWNLPIVNGAKVGANRDLQGAVVHAVNQTVEFLVGQLPKIQWQGTIVSVDGAEVMINRGAREGVKVGNRFAVGSVEVIRDPDTGEVLKEKLSKVAVVKVTSVEDRISTCAVEDGAGTIEKGMTVHPVND